MIRELVEEALHRLSHRRRSVHATWVIGAEWCARMLDEVLCQLIERWFKELTDKRLRRGVFTNVAELIEAITTWGAHWNDDPQPFIWHASAEEIIEKIQRGCAALNRQINSTTEQ